MYSIGILTCVAHGRPLGDLSSIASFDLLRNPWTLQAQCFPENYKNIAQIWTLLCRLFYCYKAILRLSSFLIDGFGYGCMYTFMRWVICIINKIFSESLMNVGIPGDLLQDVSELEYEGNSLINKLCAADIYLIPKKAQYLTNIKPRMEALAKSILWVRSNFLSPRQNSR